jgi:hypothetical protein
MRLALVLAIGILTSAISAPVSAETVAIMPVSGTNVHVSYCQIAQDVLKDHLLATGKQAVLISGPAGGPEVAPTQAIAAARGVGADLALLAHITHLQSMFRVRVTVLGVADGRTVHTDVLGSNGGPDQLDPVLLRLAQAFARGERASDNAEIDTVTTKESEPYLKKTATHTVGLRVGGILPFNRAAGDPRPGAGLGLYWLYDARDYMGELFLDAIPGQHTQEDKTSAVAVGIGLYRPFSRKDWAPYAGGGLALAATQFGGEGASGLRLHGAFGVLVGRLSTVQIRGELGYFVNAYQEIAHRHTSSNTTEHKAISHGPMLSVGIGF